VDYFPDRGSYKFACIKKADTAALTTKGGGMDVKTSAKA
jgi:hypothetical protein